MNARSKSKVVKKKTSNKNKLLLVLLVLNIILICFLFYINPMQVYRNHKFKDNIVTLLDKETITLEELIPFEFDLVYLFEPYSTKENIEKTIGFKSRFVKDNSTDKLGTEVIVVKDEKVISSIFVNLKEDGFTIKRLFVNPCLNYSTKINFRIEKSDSGIIIRQYAKDYEVKYEDIKFVISSDWIKKSWDGEEELYYFKDNKNDTFVVSKKSELTLDQFKKNLEKDYKIETTEEFFAEGYDGYLLQCINLKSKINSYNLMLNIADDVYIFSLNTNMEDARNILFNIVLSIIYDEEEV